MIVDEEEERFTCVLPASGIGQLALPIDVRYNRVSV